MQLTPTLQTTVILAPELRTLMVNLAPLTEASKTGVPAFERFLTDSVPWLSAADAVPRQLRADLQLHQHLPPRDRRVLRQQHRASEATGQNITQTKLLHYLRISNPVNPEMLTSYQRRLESNRGNPYMAPGGYQQLINGLSVFGNYLCTGNPQPTIGPTIPANLVAISRTCTTRPSRAARRAGRRRRSASTTTRIRRSRNSSPCHEL